MAVLRESKEKQNDYWQSRSERLIEESEKSAIEMTTGKSKAWRKAYNSIADEIERFYGRYAAETGLTITEVQRRLSPSELKSAKSEIAKYYEETETLGLSEEYRAYLRSLSARAYMARLEELKVNVRHEIEKLAAEQQEAFKEGLSDTYEESYYRTMFDIQQATGISGSFTALNTNFVEKTVAQKWLGDNYSNRIWNNKDKLVANLEQIIPRGIALGNNPRIIANDIQEAMETSKSNAERLALTEFSHIANQATADGYKETNIEKYQFLATLDHRTSEECSSLDGKIFKLTEIMVGINYPPVHPRCRSTTIPVWDNDEIEELFDSEATRIARDPSTNKAYYVPSRLTYSEWEESLTEDQGKAFLSAQKMDKYYKSDKDQFASYKKFITNAKKEHGKDLVSGLFDGFPTKFEDFQKLKYLDSDKWEIIKENRAKLR